MRKTTLLSIILAISFSLFASNFYASEKDSLGRQVTLTKAPTRIISLSPSATEVLFALDLNDKIIGVTEYCNFPKEATQKEKVGGFSASTISIEKIISLKPSLVISSGNIHKAIIEALENQKIPVYSYEPYSLATIYEGILKIGILTDSKNNAEKLVTSMKTKIEAITKIISTIPENKKSKVFWETFDEPLMSIGENSFISAIITISGGINIFSDIKNNAWPIVNSEDIIIRKPDVIMGADDHGDKLTIDVIINRPGWNTIPAVKNKKIFLINGDIINRQGPRITQAIEIIAKYLYPEYFK